MSPLKGASIVVLFSQPFASDFRTMAEILERVKGWVAECKTSLGGDGKEENGSHRKSGIHSREGGVFYKEEERVSVDRRLALAGRPTLEKGKKDGLLGWGLQVGKGRP